MAKMGRPKADNPKNDRLVFRVTQEEKQEIQDFMKLTGYGLLELVHEGMKAVEKK